MAASTQRSESSLRLGVLLNALVAAGSEVASSLDSLSETSGIHLKYLHPLARVAKCLSQTCREIETLLQDELLNNVLKPDWFNNTRPYVMEVAGVYTQLQDALSDCRFSTMMPMSEEETHQLLRHQFRHSEMTRIYRQLQALQAALAFRLAVSQFAASIENSRPSAPRSDKEAKNCTHAPQ